MNAKRGSTAQQADGGGRPKAAPRWRLRAGLALVACAGVPVACAQGRPAPEASAAATPQERMLELEARIARDRSLLATHVSANVDAADAPPEDLLRAIAWRLPAYQQELAERRGSDWQPEPPPTLPPAPSFPEAPWATDDDEAR